MIRRLISIILVLSLAFLPSIAHASKPKEIIVTASYGVVAGTIVGIASLAFSSEPGSHLRNIAVGASLGLYAGILLGTYLAYAVKLEPEPEKETKDTGVQEEEEEDEEEEDVVPVKDNKAKDNKKKTENFSRIMYAMQTPQYQYQYNEFGSPYNNVNPNIVPKINGAAILVPVVYIKF